MWMSPGPMNAVVAREKLYACYPDGSPFEVVVEIGTPFPKENWLDCWTCPLNIPALDCGDRHIHGGSAIQALCMALYAARTELLNVRKRGGTLGYTATSGDNFNLDAHFVLACEAAQQDPAV